MKLAIVVEGDLKAPSSIATIQRCRGGCYSFPWIAPHYSWSYLPNPSARAGYDTRSIFFYSWYASYNAECWARRYQVSFFKSFIWLDLRLNPDLLVLYRHLQHHNNTIIKTDARIMIKTQEDIFNKIYTSHFIARVRKGCVVFYYERELKTEHKL